MYYYLKNYHIKIHFILNSLTEIFYNIENPSISSQNYVDTKI